MKATFPGKQLKQIEDALIAFPCWRITRFLLDHRNAMDTVDGIAAWWAGCDAIAARAALDQLIAAGIVECHSFHGRTMYRLTRDTSICAWLETRCPDGCLSEPRDAGTATEDPDNMMNFSRGKNEAKVDD